MSNSIAASLRGKGSGLLSSSINLFVGTLMGDLFDVFLIFILVAITENIFKDRLWTQDYLAYDDIETSDASSVTLIFTDRNGPLFCFPESADDMVIRATLNMEGVVNWVQFFCATVISHNYWSLHGAAERFPRGFQATLRMFGGPITIPNG